MGDRAARRLAIDIGFAAAILACGVAAYLVSRIGTEPVGVCDSSAGGPRYDAMLADGRLTIGVVLGELAGGPTDPNAWSRRALELALRERGFEQRDPDRFVQDTIEIRIELVARDRAAIDRALAGALAGSDVVYYNGHSYRGRLTIAPPDDYRLIVLDTCWSTQLYSARLVGEPHDVIANLERSVTGSIDSLVVLLDALRDRASTWGPVLAEMNAQAVDRARLRAPLSRFKEPERYRRDVACERGRAGSRRAPRAPGLAVDVAELHPAGREIDAAEHDR